jgi:CubicO group peptidase (beta-lactamase class C family)
MMLPRAIRPARVVVAACTIALALGVGHAIQRDSVTASAQNASTAEAKVDAIFAKWTATSPGCAVGVSVDGKTALAKAYGMADLERDVKNTADTIFEAGSVSKQFTAAAVLLLARDGKLSLDDPVRKYIPELPDYGHPLTIRHMLNHTSGLRDWGSVAGIGGWPRGSRAYTHAHVLDIVSRQRALNFTPGTRWSYSNTGFNLAAILVSRVSGMPFADFTRQRIFEPLGMKDTSWRDDHTRIVKRRALSYAEDRGGFRTQMPFENVHGNGGLLTTVRDLLTWNENFVTPKVGNRAFVDEQARAGLFNDGRAHGYALGLQVGDYKGLRQVAHGGSTAGYRAYLSRYPEANVSVALLCNAASVNPGQYANAVADVYLADRARAAAAPAPKHTLTAPETSALIGIYRNTQTGEPLHIVRADNGVRIERGAVLIAMSPSRLVTASGDVFELGNERGDARMTDSYGSVETYARVTPAKPTVEQLQSLAGTYTSDDAEVEMTVAVDGDAAILKRRPDTTIRLTPVYPDAFTSQLGTVIFRREGTRVSDFSVVQDRVWDMRFTRQAAAARSTSQTASATSQTTPASAAADRWWAHVKVLADDRLEGRDTGSAGHRKAAEYVASAFERAGLKPGGVNGYIQPVTFRSRRIVEEKSSLALIRGGKVEPIVLGDEATFNMRIDAAPTIDAPIVFAGYGLTVPELKYDDLAGLDLRGKVVLLLSGGPSDIPGPLLAHYQSVRWSILKETGALGTLTITNPKGMDIPWERSMLARFMPALTLADPTLDETGGQRIAVTINPARAEKFFTGSGHSFKDILALAGAGKPLPRFPIPASVRATVTVASEDITSENVVAILPGTDPRLKDEFIVISAHLDHLGTGQPINGDAIFNGAMDNASGIATLLETAAAMRDGKMAFKRSVVLLAVTAEEKGLLGSRYYASLPTVPAGGIVANLNTDMFLPLFPLRSVVAQGLEESDLAADLRAIAAPLGLKVLSDPEPERNAFTRSDQYSFIKRGIPALSLKVGFDKDSPEHALVRKWRTERYHAPSDDVSQPVDVEAAVNFNRMYLRLIEAVANRAERPRWNADSFFRRFASATSSSR